MNQITILSKKKEDFLIEIIRKGETLGAKKADINKGRVARKKLISYLQPLVVSVVMKYVAGNIPPEELVNAGNRGIRKALLKYDPQRGFKFSTYASWYIRAEIHKKLGIPT